ncbi:glycosyltransferase family 2 protein [Colwelliaceae bacterium MEBiC 14330]
MSLKQKKTLSQKVKWWFNTRIVGFWRVKVAGQLKQKVSASPDTIKFNKDATPMPEPSNDGITVILTAYKRAEYLEQQIEALRAQTIPPKEIWLWSNRSDVELRDMSTLADRVIASNSNFLFWGRFALANLVRTKYVAFFDDDILPQPRWFENCLNTIAAGHDGILGGSGVLLPTEGGYSSKHKAGWNGNHFDSTVQVDLVGHAWFMNKAYVQYMWREDPVSWDNGEDIHLSYMALKHGGIKTLVPPHPENDQSLWSCRPDFGKIVGRLNVATYKTKDHKDTRSDIVNAHTKDGWKVVKSQTDFALPKTKLFTEELCLFNQKLEHNDNFALVRFGDGEMEVINGKAIDLSEKCNGEHKYNPGNESDEHYRQILEQSLLHKSDNYFVGLPCRCCVGDKHCDNLRSQSKQDEVQLTWANIFVNANYPEFLNSTIDALKNKTINMICHEKAALTGLPFAVNHSFRVGANAWSTNYDDKLTEITHYIKEHNIENQVFIFCAGVLSNMLIFQLNKNFPNNTYLDVGSVFDDMMGLGQTRKYLKGSKKRLKQVCVW